MLPVHGIRQFLSGNLKRLTSKLVANLYYTFDWRYVFEHHIYLFSPCKKNFPCSFLQLSIMKVAVFPVVMRYLHKVHGGKHGLATSVRLFAHLNSRTSGRIRMKFGTGVVPRGLPPNHTVQYPNIDSNKIVDDRNLLGGTHRCWILVAKVRTVSHALP
jgi:hypothetical protein